MLTCRNHQYIRRSWWYLLRANRFVHLRLMARRHRSGKAMGCQRGQGQHTRCNLPSQGIYRLSFDGVSSSCKDTFFQAKRCYHHSSPRFALSTHLGPRTNKQVELPQWCSCSTSSQQIPEWCHQNSSRTNWKQLLAGRKAGSWRCSTLRSWKLWRRSLDHARREAFWGLQT